jgi:hypothetical protein
MEEEGFGWDVERGGRGEEVVHAGTVLVKGRRKHLSLSLQTGL